MAETAAPLDSDVRAVEERLKSALWYAIGRLVDDETLSLGLNATPQYIGSLTELVWTQLENVALDLQSFARHGGRSTVNVADVLLLCRRNEGLEGMVRDYAADVAAKSLQERGAKKATANAAGTGRKRNAGTDAARTATARKAKRKEKGRVAVLRLDADDDDNNTPDEDEND